MTVVTDDQAEALRLLQEAVAVRGADFNYREHFGLGKFDDVESDQASCLYVHDEGGKLIPGCIVGMVLHNLGVDLYAVQEHEGLSADDLMVLYSDLDPEALLLFNHAQSAQDKGGTWGEAVATARALVGA